MIGKYAFAGQPQKSVAWRLHPCIEPSRPLQWQLAV